MSVRPAKTQISLGIRPVWSKSSLCAHWVTKDQMFLYADSEDSDQTGRMPRLFWVFSGHKVIFWFCYVAAQFQNEKPALKTFKQYLFHFYYTESSQNF